MQAQSIREGLLLSESKGVERLVLAGLLDCAGQKTLLAWPSVKWLMRYSKASERGVQMGLKKLMAKGEIELIERGGGRKKSNTYFISIFNQPGEVPERNPAGNGGVGGPHNPASFARNPAVSSPNPAKYAPKRKERNEQERYLLEDHGSTAIGADTIGEVMVGLVGAAWSPWASKITTIFIKEGIAQVVVEGEYAAEVISKNFIDALLFALRKINDDLKEVRINARNGRLEEQRTQKWPSPSKIGSPEDEQF